MSRFGRASDQSYVAGGVALNHTLQASRLSRDVDLFHDTLEALDATWQADRALLQNNRYDLHLMRERSGFVEAEVARDGDSARQCFSFFPIATQR